MMIIGKKIKELRKKKDMTQEKLADYLGVSYQAVSKWENGAACPDLSLIIPISKILDVSVDELFGVGENTNEAKRKKELYDAHCETWQNGNTERRYEIALAATKEFPGDFNYLEWLADAEVSYGTHNCDGDKAKQTEMWESAAKHYEMIIDDCKDRELRDAAIYSLVMLLPDIGRREEAVAYAKEHPEKNQLLRWCLTGSEANVHRQKMIYNALHELVFSLEWGKRDLACAKMAEDVIKTVFPDGNYLNWHARLAENKMIQAKCFAKKGMYDEAVTALTEAAFHAKEFDMIEAKSFRAPLGLRYTSPAFDLISFNYMSRSGMTTELEDFKTNLASKVFDPMRDREDFKKLENI